MKSSENLLREIEGLTKKFNKLILSDDDKAYKDRDFHWYIEIAWSYGEEPEYKVIHNGYIIGNIEINCSSYELALLELKQLLEKAIKHIQAPKTSVCELFN